MYPFCSTFISRDTLPELLFFRENSPATWSMGTMETVTSPIFPHISSMRNTARRRLSRVRNFPSCFVTLISGSSRALRSCLSSSWAAGVITFRVAVVPHCAGNYALLGGEGVFQGGES